MTKHIPFAEIPVEVPDEEHIDTCKEWLKKNRENFAQCANFVIIDSEGNRRSKLHKACHREVAEWEGILCVGTEIGIRRHLNRDENLSLDLFEPYLRWFLYESFFGRFILNRDDFEFCRDYGIVVSTGIPSNIFQAIMITSRNFWEFHPKVFEKFNELSEKGINKDLLFAMLMGSGRTTRGGTAYSMALGNEKKSPVTWCYGHRAFGGPMSKATLDNILLHRAIKRNLCKTFQKAPSLYKVRDLVKENEDKPLPLLSMLEREFPKVHEAVMISRNKGKPVMYRPPNPFDHQTNVLKEQFTYVELYEVVLPALQKQYEEEFKDYAWS